jgi:hypothetical protein
MESDDLRHLVNQLDGKIARMGLMIKDARALGLVSLERRRRSAQALLRARRRRLILKMNGDPS